MSNSTVLRFIKAQTAQALSIKVGSLPYKIEIKTILKEGTDFVCFFTLPDRYEGVTNENIKKVTNASK